MSYLDRIKDLARLRTVTSRDLRHVGMGSLDLARFRASGLLRRAPDRAAPPRIHYRLTAALLVAVIETREARDAARRLARWTPPKRLALG